MRIHETLQILLQYVDTNHFLIDYINSIKLVLGTLTPKEFVFLDQDPDSINALLEYKQYDLILAYDNYLNHEVEIGGNNFTCEDQLLCLLKCKHITVSEPKWMHLFTLPLLAKIFEYKGSKTFDQLITEIKNCVPDYLDLVQLL